MFNRLHNISDQEQFEKHLYNPRIYQKKEMEPRTPVILIIVWKVKYSLRFVVCYVQPITQQCESRIVQKTPLQSK